MSAGEPIQGGGSSGSGNQLNQVTPKLVGANGTEFTPDVVTRLSGALPWDTQSTQLQCGSTVVENNDDFNHRITFECVAKHSEFMALQSMRAEPGGVKLVSAPYSGTVTFDELRWEQIADANGAVQNTGEQNTEPRYKIQLQSKEEDQ